MFRLRQKLVSAFALATLTASACGGGAQSAAIVPTPPPPASAPAPAPAETPAPAPAEASVPELAFPEDDFRKQPPAAGEPRGFQQPTIERFKLKNGIEVYLIERHQLPTVSMQLVFPGGEVNDPPGKEGLASLCVGLMAEGTEALEKIPFEEAQADLGSSIWTWAGADEQGVAMRTLTRHFDKTLDLFADVVMRPGMRDEEFDRAVKQRLNHLLQIKGNPQAVAGRIGPSVVWGEKHPYGRFFTEKSTSAITHADCQKYVKEYFKPVGAKLFVLGDITRREIEEKVGARFAKFRGKPKASNKIGKPAPRKGRVFFVDIPNAPQSVVLLTHLGPERKAKDYFPTSLMATILGGGFASRINMNIREKHGYAYGARGGFSYTRTGSAFTASASVRADVTKESIVEMLKEIRGMRDGEATDPEMEREKNGFILGLPAQFSTGSSVLQTFRNLVYYGLPLDYYASFVDNVKKVTKADVKRAAQKHLKPDQLQLVVVGDAKTVLPKIEELVAAGEFGKTAIVKLDVDGNVVP